MSRRPPHPLAQVRAARKADEATIDRLRIVVDERRLRRDQAIHLWLDAQLALDRAVYGADNATEIERMIRQAEETI